MTQEHDVKTFDSDKVPARTLAVARCAVEFTDTHRDTPVFDIDPYLQDGVYTSTTSQLRWKEGSSPLDGFITINTPATKGVVGFAQGTPCDLGNVTITPQSRFAAIYVTAQEPDRDLVSSENLLVVAVARARNTGMKVFLDSRMLSKGQPPVVMEPVKAKIHVRKEGAPTVYLLDHDGCRTGQTLPVGNSTFEINGARDKTCYYLLAYGDSRRPAQP